VTAPGWIPVPEESDFPLENLPFGVVEPRSGTPRVVVRIGDHVLDLAAAGIAPELTAQPRLNELMASPRHHDVRRRAADVILGSAHPEWTFRVDDVEVLLPVAVGDFVDFYASIHHATNLGRILRPEGEPLLPNWRHLPVGYHGRAGTIVCGGCREGAPK